MSLGIVGFASDIWGNALHVEWDGRSSLFFFLKGHKKDWYWRIFKHSGRMLLYEGILHQLFKQNLMKRIINEATRRASWL